MSLPRAPLPDAECGCVAAHGLFRVYDTRHPRTPHRLFRGGARPYAFVVFGPQGEDYQHIGVVTRCFTSKKGAIRFARFADRFAIVAFRRGDTPIVSFYIRH